MVWVVPCGLRADQPQLSSPEHRLEMTNLAVKQFFGEKYPVKVDDIEVKNGESIPTIELLDRYKVAHPNYEFWFVMGTDLIQDLHTWTPDFNKLINETKFLIFERPGFDQNELMKHKNWPKQYKVAFGSQETHKNVLGSVLSSELYERINQNLGIFGLTPTQVITYIKQHKLYIK